MSSPSPVLFPVFHHAVLLQCSPYLHPLFFNPYGQILLGEAMAFFGLCVRYGCERYLDDTEWFKFWSPVWAGALVSALLLLRTIGALHALE